jgi:hypothetical protein
MFEKRTYWESEVWRSFSFIFSEISSSASCPSLVHFPLRFAFSEKPWCPTQETNGRNNEGGGQRPQADSLVSLERSNRHFWPFTQPSVSLVFKGAINSIRTKTKTGL